MTLTQLQGVEKHSSNLSQGAPSVKPTKKPSHRQWLKTLKSTSFHLRKKIWYTQLCSRTLGLASSPCVASPPCLSREVVDQTSRPEHWWRLEPPEEPGDPPGVWTRTHTGLSKSRKPSTWGKGTRWHPDQLYYHSLGTNKLGLVSAVLIRSREMGDLQWEIKTLHPLVSSAHWMHSVIPPLISEDHFLYFYMTNQTYGWFKIRPQSSKSAMTPGYIRNLTVFYCHLRAKCISTMTSDPDCLTSLSCCYQNRNKRTQNTKLGSCTTAGHSGILFTLSRMTDLRTGTHLFSYSGSAELKPMHTLALTKKWHPTR